MSISYFSLLPLYVKSPPHRMTSHHVYTCIIVLGHIPVGHSYWKTNLSPFSKPSLQCPAFPSVAVSSNSQSSVHHFLITNLPLPNINIVRLYHYNKNLPIKQLQLFRQVSTLAEAVGFEPTSPWGLPDFESFPPCDFWWKLSEDGSTQRKPKSCGILRILASVFRFYLNPQGFPSSSHFCPELWPEDRTRIELDARLGVFTPIPFHENANHHFD